MSSLSDKLKALGVQVGSSHLKPAPAPRRAPGNLEEMLGGRPLSTSQGETFIIEQRIPTGQAYGRARLALNAPLHGIARWAGDERVAGLPAQAFAFLDTETTGLAGGSGTLAFLIGVGRFEENEFHLAQFFLRAPIEEPAQLAALEEFLAPCQAIVTFNGKSFDIPLLHTRYTMQGWQPPFGERSHLDLLHLARRLWRERIASRTLANLEIQILEASRTEEDIPGWDIPRIYQEYLLDQDPGEIKRVLYHNALDVISLAALIDHMAGLLADPLQAQMHGVDLIALAKLFEDLGDLQTAANLYLLGLNHHDAQADDYTPAIIPRHVLLDAIQRLASIYKHPGERQDYAAAVRLWEQGASRQHLDSFVELAKFYEHQQKDYSQAITWTQAALELVERPAAPTLQPGMAFSAFTRRQWREELRHRLERLQKKLTS